MLNGRCGSDKGLGKFTCHTPRGRSAVDYVCVSDSLLSICDQFEVIYDAQMVSDHSFVMAFNSFSKHPPNITTSAL